MPQTTSDHSRLDRRSLALHKLVAEKIVADPAMLDTARENVRRWLSACQSSALDEWDEILKRPIEKIVAVLTDPSEEATRLRQSSPFAGILNEAERQAIYEPKSGSWLRACRQRIVHFPGDDTRSARCTASPSG